MELEVPTQVKYYQILNHPMPISILLDLNKKYIYKSLERIPWGLYIWQE